VVAWIELANRTSELAWASSGSKMSRVSTMTPRMMERAAVSGAD